MSPQKVPPVLQPAPTACKCTEQNEPLSTGARLSVLPLTAPELARTVTIAPDGTITLPLAGTLPAAGSTLGELKARIEAAYASELLEPVIEIVRLQVN